MRWWLILTVSAAVSSVINTQHPIPTSPKLKSWGTMASIWNPGVISYALILGYCLNSAMFSAIQSLAVKSNQNQIKIESYFAMKSKCFCWNQIESYPNRVKWLFSIRFDFDKNLNKKNFKLRQENMKNSQNRILKGIVKYLCLLVINSFENWPFFWWLIFFHDHWCSFVLNSNVFLNQINIKSKSNWTVSAISRSKIGSKPIQFDSPGCIYGSYRHQAWAVWFSWWIFCPRWPDACWSFIPSIVPFSIFSPDSSYQFPTSSVFRPFLSYAVHSNPLVVCSGVFWRVHCQ